jgi:2-aminobenzoylacetyl-CoA thioesterase
MFFDSPGEVNERLVRLGTDQSVMYLAKGDRYMLIGGGGQWVVPALEEQIEAYGIDMQRVQYLLIGHSHYDHCGAVPYLQKKYPHIEILASHGAAKLFDMEKAVKNMQKFSRLAMDAMGVPDEVNGIPLEFDNVRLARSLGEGDRVDLGDGLNFEVFESPGHSRCSLIAYAPEQKWLFPSDSMPVPCEGGKRLMCTASEGYNAYISSLRKLEDRPIDLCAWEHYGYMTGDEARRIISTGIEATLKYKRLLQERVRELDSVDKVAEWAARDWLEVTGFKFLPHEVMVHISRTMVVNALEEEVI